MNVVRSAIRVFIMFLALPCTFAVAKDANTGRDRPPVSRLLYNTYERAAPGDNGDNAETVQIPDSTPCDTVVADEISAGEDNARDYGGPLDENAQTECVSGCRPSCCDCPCPTIYGQVEALFLYREPRFRRQAIIVDPNTETTFLSTSDLDFDMDPGLRTTFGMRICGGRALEFTYFSLADGDADAAAESIDPADFLILPDNLFGNIFVDPDSVGVGYSSSLDSFEMNLPCCCGCCDRCGCGEVRCRSTEWFVGFRNVNLDEELHISAQRNVNGGLEEGSYDIRATNHLYGVQVGARERRTRGRFGWEATGKFGVFGNDARQVQSVTDFPDYPLRPTVSSTGSQVAFIGDTNLSALYRLTDVWNLRAGYNLIWIEGLALAPDQLDFDFASATGGGQLHSGGGIFLHGVNVGLEARW